MTGYSYKAQYTWFFSFWCHTSSQELVLLVGYALHSFFRIKQVIYFKDTHIYQQKQAGICYKIQNTCWMGKGVTNFKYRTSCIGSTNSEWWHGPFYNWNKGHSHCQWMNHWTFYKFSSYKRRSLISSSFQACTKGSKTSYARSWCYRTWASHPMTPLQLGNPSHQEFHPNYTTWIPYCILKSYPASFPACSF